MACKRKRSSNPGGVAAARDEYKRSHWGDAGDGKVERLIVADYSEGPLVVLGHLVAVVYQTTKQGDPPDSEYEHEFTGKRPLLCYSPRGKRLVIAGGTYHMSPRGIVG